MAPQANMYAQPPHQHFGAMPPQMYNPQLVAYAQPQQAAAPPAPSNGGTHSNTVSFGGIAGIAAVPPQAKPQIERQKPRGPRAVWAKIQARKCPFSHSTIQAGPYPGYPHGKKHNGKNPVCKFGCEIEASFPKREGESDIECFTREALEYQRLLWKEDQQTEQEYMARCEEILQKIESTGTYKLTTKELAYSVQVAWRNAPKCVGRKFWKLLNLIDRRDCYDPDEMWTHMKDHMVEAWNGGQIRPTATVFPPPRSFEREKNDQYTRMLTNQYYRYCGWVMKDGSILGDPANVAQTKWTQDTFGWDIEHDKRTRFDILPIVWRTDDGKFHWREVPDTHRYTINIRHPDYDFFEELQLEWFAIPAVVNMYLDVGGHRFRNVPFNGWFLSYEVATLDLAHHKRYNVLPEIAEAMNLDTSQDEPLWKEQAHLALHRACLYSFKKAGATLMTHHKVCEEFMDFWQFESTKRGYMPGNWKWLVPATSAALTDLYLRGNTIREFTLKPAFIFNKTYKEIADLNKKMKSITSGDNIEEKKTEVLVPKPVINVYWASQTGNVKKFAKLIKKKLKDVANVNLYNMEIADAREIAAPIANDKSFLGRPLTIFITSTFGDGAFPGEAQAFCDNIPAGFNEEYSCIGFGDSKYKFFNKAVKDLEEKLKKQNPKNQPIQKTVLVDAKFGDEAEEKRKIVVDLLSNLVMTYTRTYRAGVSSMTRNFSDSSAMGETKWRDCLPGGGK